MSIKSPTPDRLNPNRLNNKIVATTIKTVHTINIQSAILVHLPAKRDASFDALKSPLAKCEST